MYPNPSIVALRDRLSIFGALRPSPTDFVLASEIRKHVCDAVDDLKSAGWPVERVVNAMKDVIIDAGLAPSQAVRSMGGPSTDRNALLVDMVRWCIDRYYNQEVGVPDD